MEQEPMSEADMIKRIAELEFEVRILRQWGNKDCTAMADKRMEEIRNGDPE